MSNPPDWQIPSGKTPLEDFDVYIWKIELIQPASVVSDLFQALSEDEWARSRRFHFVKDRDRFIVGRGALRAILSRYTEIPPGELVFDYSLQAKPFLAKECKGEQVRFNLSHSHELALLGVTGRREIGIDIEYLRPEFAGLEIAERYFSPREVVALKALSPQQQTEAFFNCWTRKEAFIKARGEGLSCPLDRFDVTLQPRQPAKILNIQWNPPEVSQWSMQTVPAGEKYRAAVCVRGNIRRVYCWKWVV